MNNNDSYSPVMTKIGLKIFLWKRKWRDIKSLIDKVDLSMNSYIHVFISVHSMSRIYSARHVIKSQFTTRLLWRGAFWDSLLWRYCSDDVLTSMTGQCARWWDSDSKLCTIFPQLHYQVMGKSGTVAEDAGYLISVLHTCGMANNSSWSSVKLLLDKDQVTQTLCD